MLITLLVLAVLNLVLLFVVYCGQRALWARLPEPSQTADQAYSEWRARAAAYRANPPTLTPEEVAQIAAYRAKYGEAMEGQSDLEVLALFRLSPA